MSATSSRFDNRKEEMKMSVGTLPDDRELRKERNVKARYAVLLSSAIGIPVIGAVSGSLLTYIFSGNGVFAQIGAAVGSGAGFVAFMAAKHRFFVNNPTTGILLTVDSLKALLNSSGDIFVAYGPGGPHVSFPWEQRSAENNISVKAATVDFGPTEIQCLDGTVKIKGSARLRPDHKDPRRFQTGVASVGEDLTDLILGFLLGELSSMKVSDLLKNVGKINTMLASEFVSKDSNKPDERTEFEKTQGVYVIDVTVSEVLPSTDVQRTISALTEAKVIAIGTRVLLGFKTDKALKEALKTKQVTTADYNHARDRFLSISGNMDGVTVNRHEIDLNASGVNEATAVAITAVLKNVPPQILAGLATQTKKGK